MKSVLKHIVGERFGRLVVVCFSHTKNEAAHWYCRCDCGGESIVRGYSLRHRTKSCGCLHREASAATCRSFTKHGLHGTRIYRIWNGMKTRCTSPRHNRWHVYGGRGIAICPGWSTIESFMKWALSSGYADHLSIDRINPNGNYEPSNCRWATDKEQQGNRRNSRRIVQAKMGGEE